MALIFATLLYFALTALLWYMRPGGVGWLTGSLLLGGAWMAWFLWYVTRPPST